MQAFGKGFHKAVGQDLHHDLVVLVVLGRKAVDVLAGTLDGHGKGSHIIRIASGGLNKVA